MNNNQGVYILNTRPGKRGEALTIELEQYGFRVLTQPIQKMIPLTIDISLLNELDKNQSDWIFISPTAVECFVKEVSPDKLKLKYKPKLLAVGKGTAAVLKCYFPQYDIYYPEGSHGAEALLELIFKQASKTQSYYIFRGETGSKLLSETLKSQGADVKSIICYKRQVTDAVKNGSLNHLLQSDYPKIVILTSFEAFELLHYYYTNALWLKHALITVTSKRMLHWAKKMGYEKVLFLESLDNEAILNKIILNNKPSV
ncbi:uroporphyrinogen-III synthase [bacterium SCSIO 12844]|nr:uroporphyrinogen-III synthase [bacterium SCSIO 12844]